MKYTIKYTTRETNSPIWRTSGHTETVEASDLYEAKMQILDKIFKTGNIGSYEFLQITKDTGEEVKLDRKYHLCE
jgi:uncharacterized membrane-anchored protein YjiN (DUF445 family)